MTWTAHDEFRLRQIEDHLVGSDPRWARQFVEWRAPGRYRRIDPWRMALLVIATALGVGLGIGNVAVVLMAFVALIGVTAAAMLAGLRRARRDTGCGR
ncbi:DUF3040 domain-containing protein [Streptomyces sp. NPDC051320]|uniref:DUF3040 domain-containing protein n=1 Tax=Streptomyces sp. NPDC051320 TaxID=3154644 RepID=UPI003438A6B7